jgi:acyl-CoA synthetase (AMP-forming)/AMP-acid ligase II
MVAEGPAYLRHSPVKLLSVAVVVLLPRPHRQPQQFPGRARRPVGEVPKAFIVQRPSAQVTGEEIIQFTRERIAHFKCPKYVEFAELPKTATGKIQKYLLREREWEGYDKRIHGSTVQTT